MIFVTMKKGDNSPHFTKKNKSLNLQKLQNSIVQKESYIHLKGLYGSAKSFIIEKLFKKNTVNMWKIKKVWIRIFHLKKLKIYQ